MERAIQVYLLAASRLVRDALTRLISRKGDISVVGAAACSPAVLDTLLSTDYDLLLADWASCCPAILGTLSDLREQRPDHKALLLGVKPDRDGFLQAVRAGARGILLEDASASDVIAAIRTVVAGDAVCPPLLCTHLFEAVAQQARHIPSARLRVRLGLTRREQQLVPLIAQGYTNKEIATQLCLSEQTVKNHVHRMLQKTGVNDRLEVVEACAEEPTVSVSDPTWL